MLLNTVLSAYVLSKVMKAAGCTGKRACNGKLRAIVDSAHMVLLSHTEQNCTGSSGTFGIVVSYMNCKHHDRADASRQRI